MPACNLLGNHASWRCSAIFDQRADCEVVLAIAVAVIIGVQSVNVRSSPAGNFRENSFVKEFLPLLRDNPIGGRFFRVRGAGLDSDNGKSGYVGASNGILLRYVVGRASWAFRETGDACHERIAVKTNSKAAWSATRTTTNSQQPAASSQRPTTLLDFHHFLLFGFAHVFHLLNFIVGKLLDFSAGTLLFVFGDLLVF